VPKRRRSLLPQSASMALRANVYSAAAAVADARTTTRARPAHAAPAAAAAADAAPAFDLRPTIDAIIALASQKLEAIAQLTGNAQKPAGQAFCRFIAGGVKCKRRARAPDTAEDFKVVCKVCNAWRCIRCMGPSCRIVLGSDALKEYKCADCEACPKEKWWDVGTSDEEDGEESEDEAAL
jgi:hypothetical protein